MERAFRQREETAEAAARMLEERLAVVLKCETMLVVEKRKLSKNWRDERKVGGW